MRSCRFRNSIIQFILLLHIFQLSDAWGFFQSQNTSRIRRQSSCAPDTYRCTNGQCIPEEKQCDGKYDCNDRSDETSVCGAIRCADIFFQCKYGACINGDLECDGKKDCVDNSDETSPRCKRDTSGCNKDQFQCRSGQCVESENQCDGTSQCNDGSDETFEQCANFPCPPFAYRCAYGACVNDDKRCNGVTDCVDGSDEEGCLTPELTSPTPPGPRYGCTLPPHPPFGEFKFLSGEAYVPQRTVGNGTLVLLECRNGWMIGNQNLLYCGGLSWTTDLRLFTCIRTCPVLPESKTVTVTCTLNRAPADCLKPQEGMIATPECIPLHSAGTTIPILECRGGTWDNDLPNCVPECGKKHVDVETLVIGGSNTKIGEYPWVVGIYNETEGLSHICGGSLITRIYVLSAAHCFTFTRNGQKTSDRFTVIAGIYHRNIEKQTEHSKQVFENVDVLINEDYRGALQQYSNDIALINLKRPVHITLDVQLVCIDWTSVFEDDAFQPNNKAVVAGWGLTAETDKPAEVLKKLIVPYINKDTCRLRLPDLFQERYYTYDKFCAGFDKNSTSVCKGDSGGGLYFRSPDKVNVKYFVRGIVSLSPPKLGGCDSNYYAMYTKVSKHMEWIVRITRKIL